MKLFRPSDGAEMSPTADEISIQAGRKHVDKHSVRQLLLFAVAGTVGFGVDVLILYTALACGSGYYLGRLISFSGAATATWLINRNYTFASGRNGSLLREWVTYLAAMIGGGLVNYAAFAAVVWCFADQPLRGVIGVFVGSIAGMFMNYFASKNLVFNASRIN